MKDMEHYLEVDSQVLEGKFQMEQTEDSLKYQK